MDYKPQSIRRVYFKDLLHERNKERQVRLANVGLQTKIAALKFRIDREFQNVENTETYISRLQKIKTALLSNHQDPPVQQPNDSTSPESQTSPKFSQYQNLVDSPYRANHEGLKHIFKARPGE